MSAAALTVWVVSVDPLTLAQDHVSQLTEQLIELAKPFGDVSSVAVDYSTHHKTNLFRIRFREAQSAETMLRLEGIQLNTHTLSFWSAEYGSRPPMLIGENVTRGSRGEAADEEEEDVSGRDPPPHLDYFYHLRSSVRMCEALLPSFQQWYQFSDAVRAHGTETGITASSQEVAVAALAAAVNHENESQTLVTDADIRELMQHEDIGGVDNVVAVIEQYVATVEKMGKLQDEVKKLQETARVQEEEANRAREAARKAFRDIRPSAYETRQEAEQRKLVRIRNQTALSTGSVLPVTILSKLVSLCGPITTHYIEYFQSPYPYLPPTFTITIEFMTATAAQRALSALRGQFELPKRRLHGLGEMTDSDFVDLMQDIKGFGAGGQWDFAVKTLPRGSMQSGALQLNPQWKDLCEKLRLAQPKLA